MRRLAVCTLILSVLLSACGDDDGDGSADLTTTTRSERQELQPTYPASECCEQAALSGGPDGFSLAGDPESGCVWFEGADAARVSTIWPEGFTVSFQPLRVFDPEGNVFAEAGEVYTSLGGSEEQSPPAECQQPADVSIASWRMGEVTSAPKH